MLYGIGAYVLSSGSEECRLLGIMQYLQLSSGIPVSGILEA